MARKKEAHHGGAWKVAFADFMTAMMALFLVLWICAQDDKIVLATSQYFQHPFASPEQSSAGLMPFNTSKSVVTSQPSSENERKGDSKVETEKSFLNTVAKDFYRLLHLDQNEQDKPIDIQVTSDGLRVTLFDRARRPLFVKDTTEFTEWGRYVMQGLAWTIERYHFRVSIDGHTTQVTSGKSPDYSAWELSADRANAARRSLVHYAIDEKTIERVTGYAGTRPLPGEKANSEANERVTLSLTLNSKVTPDAPADPAPKAKTVKNSILSRMVVGPKKPSS